MNWKRSGRFDVAANSKSIVISAARPFQIHIGLAKGSFSLFSKIRHCKILY